MIVIFGPAGVGKSTQAQILADKLDRKWLSAGQIIRDSGKFNDFTSKAAMIDEKTLIELISGAVADVEREGKDVVFDGQPGSPEQVSYWVESGLMDKVECVLVLKAPEEVLIERLSGRGREDDDISNWKKKIDYFEQKIYSFLTEIESHGKQIFEIDGNGSIEEVSDRVWRKLEAKKIV
ncbi:MAG: nucleoside monophosphate kinase [Candidatus Saccharibacteria bacterium]|nr:nucleoside monophosphate kinase [Candidatus Saccharibacteria bacterium]